MQSFQRKFHLKGHGSKEFNMIGSGPSAWNNPRMRGRDLQHQLMMAESFGGPSNFKKFNPKTGNLHVDIQFCLLSEMVFINEEDDHPKRLIKKVNAEHFKGQNIKPKPFEKREVSFDETVVVHARKDSSKPTRYRTLRDPAIHGPVSKDHRNSPVRKILQGRETRRYREEQAIFRFSGYFNPKFDYDVNKNAGYAAMKHYGGKVVEVIVDFPNSEYQDPRISIFVPFDLFFDTSRFHFSTREEARLMGSKCNYRPPDIPEKPDLIAILTDDESSDSDVYSNPDYDSDCSQDDSLDLIDYYTGFYGLDDDRDCGIFIDYEKIYKKHHCTGIFKCFKGKINKTNELKSGCFSKVNFYASDDDDDE